MNSLWQGLVSIASRTILSANVTKTILSAPATLNTSFMSKRFLPTLLRMHQKNMEWLEFGPRKKKKRKGLEGKPFAKGIVLKTLIKKPRKPNSANRKCVLVRLSTGKEMVAFVPGVGHNLQEHQTVLCRNGRLKDTPGVKIRCVRGAYDLPLVRPKK